jgi:tetratricopeptide (TPR) repeat protein
MFALQRPAQLDELLGTLDRIKFVNPSAVAKTAQEALAIAERYNDLSAQSKAHAHLSWAAMFNSRRPDSVEYATTAFLLAQNAQDPREEARALGMLGAALIFAGLIDEAMVCYQRAEWLAVEYDFPDALGMTLSDLGLIAMRRGQNEQALVLFERSLRTMPQETGGGAGLGIVWGNLGVTYVQMGRYEQAEDSLRRSLAIVTQARALTWMGYIRVALADTALKQADDAKAQRYLNEAYDVALQIEVPSLTLDVYRMQSELAHSRKDMRTALSTLAQAYDYAHAHGLRSALPPLLTELAKHYSAAGDTPNSLACDQEALRLQQALQDADIDDRLTILRVLYRLRDSLDFRFIASNSETSLDKLLEQERERIAQEKQYELSTFRERVAYRIAHELRNPLAVVRSSSEMLKSYAHQMPEERRAQHLDQILAETERLSLLITDILELLSPGSSTPR